MNYSNFFENVRAKSPLVHHITNYVTVNDCANVTLAIGASPIMTANIDELDDIIKISSSLVVNIGTMNQMDSYKLAPKIANKYGKPIIFDPVGVGASAKRNETVKEMLGAAKFSVIKGNISEIMSIAGLSSSTKGVDVSDDDKDMSVEKISKIAMNLANKYDCVIAVTGKDDIVANSNCGYKISNGVAFLSNITGTGCMSASLIGSFVGANDDKLLSTVVAITTMCIAGELAYEKTKDIGTSSFRVSLIDAISMMNVATFEKYAKIEKIA